MPDYREEFVRMLYGIILAQFVVITILLGGFTSEYLSNVFFRIWVETSFPQLGLLLTGQFDALIIGMALGGTILLVQRMKNQPGTGQTTTLTAAQPSSSEERSDLLPNYATQSKKGELVSETPEQILRELEKQDF